MEFDSVGANLDLLVFYHPQNIQYPSCFSLSHLGLITCLRGFLY